MKRRMKKILAYVLAFITIVSTTYTGSIVAEAAQAGDNVIDSLSAEKMYDGTPLTAGASMRWVDDNHEFVYTMASSITDVGSVQNTFASYDVLNSNGASVLADYQAGLTIYKDGMNYSVSPVTIRETGTLTVTPRTGVVVTITGNSSTVPYTGAAQSVSGYTVSINDSLYKETDFTFNGNASAGGTDAGTYSMGLSADQFTNTNGNFADVQFVIAQDGVLNVVNEANVLSVADVEGEETNASAPEANVPAPVAEKINFTIKTETASKEYDGTPLTAGASAEGLADGHTLQCTTTSITNAGRAVNKVLSWDIVDANGNSVKELYAEPEVLNGYLEVKPRTVILVVEGEHVLRGYQEGVSYTFSDRDENGDYTFWVNILDDLYTEADYEYVGNVSVTASEEGIYELAITEDMFVNKNSNFYIAVSFMNMPKMQIQSGMWSGGTWYYGYVIAGSATKEYDGTPLTCNTVRGMNGSSGELIDGVTAMMTPESTITNVGSVENVIKSYSGMPTYFDGIKKINGTLTVVPRTGVTVTITPNSATVDYDGTAHTVSGYTVSIRDAGGLHDLYTEADFTFSGNASVTATEAGTYTMNLSADDFTNNNPNFADVEFVIADGGVLTIEREPIDFTITTQSATKEYDGTPLTAEATAEGLATGHTLQCTTTSITDAGTATNEVVSWDIVDAGGNSVKDQYNEPTIIEGTLTVTPLDVVVVNIIGNAVHSFTNDSEQKATGYTVTTSTPLYTKADFAFTGDATAKGTEAGTYWMGLEPGQFENISGNFTNVHFVVTDGYLAISEGGSTSGGSDYVVLTIAGRNARKMYDGTPLTAGYVVSGLIKGDTLKVYMCDDAITDVGTAPNRIESYYYRSYLGSQYRITTIYAEVNEIDGILEVVPRTGVTVTITPNSDTVVWDGSEHTISGYTVSISDAGGLHDLYKESDFTFSGNASVSGTEPGTYTMNLSADDFTNNNPNFADVNFVIADAGVLTIEEPPTIDDEIVVTIVGNSETVTYNGEEQSVSGYTVAGISDARYTVDDFTFTGTANAGGTNAGTYAMGLSADDFENTNRIFTNVKFVVQDGQVTVDPYDAEVVVNVTGNGKTYTYDGTEKTAEGYTVEISDPLFDEDDIAFNGTASASGTNAGTYDMGIAPEDFENLNQNFTNVKFVVTEGSDKLVINPSDEEIVVKVTGNGTTYTYDGTEKTADGYTVEISNPLLTEDDIKFNGDASAKGTNAGEYEMGITPEDFENLNQNFSNVTFEVVEGSDKLVIEKIDGVTVTVTENSGSFTYDGDEKTVTGYTVTSISNALYTADDFKFIGDATVKGTDAGTYDMEVSADDFVNMNSNFTNVTFVVNDGQMIIGSSLEEVTVIITENSDTVTYNGTEQSVTGYTVTSISNALYTADDFTFNGTASAAGTNAGTYDMEVEASDFVNNNANFSKVTFVVVDGMLTISPMTEEIVVTITGNGTTVTYTGEEQTADGYTVTSSSNLYTEDNFTFSGEGSASGTNVGTYDMDIDPEDFTNNNPNFTNVTFVVVEGSDKLVIEPYAEEIIVTVTGNGTSYTYDGTEKVAEGYTVASNNTLYAADADDFEFNGTAYAKGTDADTYDMGIAAGDFVNTNTNFSNIKFVVAEGSDKLVINPVTEEVVVEIIGNGGTYTYDGTEKVVEGYEIESSNPLFTEEDIKFSGEAEAKGTDAGEYDMGIAVEDFTNISKNFTNVTFVVVEETVKLIIEKAGTVTVTITEKSETYTYDGNEKTVTGYDVSIDNALYGEDDFTFNGTASVSGTDAGSYDMEIEASDFVNNNNNFKEVIFVVVDGQLTIEPNDEEVVVTITGNGATYTYDGTEKTADGYTVEISNPLLTEDDLKFSGEASAKGTDAGEYDMGIAPEDFENLNKNFTNVTFEVVEGSDKLVIEPSDEAITVTITGNGATYTYDGTEKTADGYTMESSNALYTEDDFSFSGKASASGTDAGEYDMGIAAEDFANISKNFTNVTFEVVEGSDKLIIEPSDEEIIVTVTGNGTTHTYDGTEKTADGYTVEINNPLFTEDDLIFNGEASASGTDTGEYDMGIAPEDFENISNNFTNVTVIVTEGSDKLVIDPITDPVTVIITENSASPTYNGKEQSVEGYTVTSISNALYTENDFTFNGNAVVEGTEAGTYEMDVKAEDFENTNKNFTNVIFEVVDGQLMIGQVDEITVIITENSGSFTYDGTEQTVTGYTVSIDENAPYTEADFTFTGDATVKGTDAGTYDMELSAEDFVNNNAGIAKVNFVIVDGKLTISPITEEVEITITGNGGTYPYDRTEKTADGYTVESSNPLFKEEDLEFNGEGKASGTDAGEYDMGISPEDFENISKNFTNVTIVVTEGSDKLVIEPITDEIIVKVTGNSASYTYDGTEKTVSGYTISEITNALYTDKDFSFAGNAEAKGTAAGTYNMKFTAADFVNNNQNFTNIVFVVDTNGGKLIINEIPMYGLTIHYVDTDGNMVAADYSGRFTAGTTFTIFSPEVAGYTPNYASISSPATGMPAQNLEFTVVYTANPVEEVAPEVVTPEEPDADDAVVDEDDAEDTEERESVNINDDGVARDDGDIPVSAIESVDVVITEDEDGNLTLVPVDDEDTALADFFGNHEGHACNIANFLFMLATLGVVIAYSKRMKKLQAKIWAKKDELGMK